PMPSNLMTIVFADMIVSPESSLSMLLQSETAAQGRPHPGGPLRPQRLAQNAFGSHVPSSCKHAWLSDGPHVPRIAHRSVTSTGTIELVPASPVWIETGIMSASATAPPMPINLINP